MREPLEAPKKMHEYMREIIRTSNYESANILRGVKRIDALNLKASKSGPMRVSVSMFLLSCTFYIVHYYHYIVPASPPPEDGL